MNSANNEPTTARNTPNPIFAGGTDEATLLAPIGDHAFLQPRFGCQPLLREPPSRNRRYCRHEQDDGAHGWAPCADNLAGGSFCGTKSLVAPGTL